MILFRTEIKNRKKNSINIKNIQEPKLYNQKTETREREADQDEVEEGGLVDLDELGVPGLEVFVGGGGGGVLLEVDDDLGEDFAGDVWEGDEAIGAGVLHHVLDGSGLRRLLRSQLELLSVVGLHPYHPRSLGLISRHLDRLRERCSWWGMERGLDFRNPR